MFLLTSQPPPPGSRIEISVTLPEGATLTLHGTVSHIITPERAAADGLSPGIGVKLDQTHLADLARLGQRAAARAAARERSGLFTRESVSPILGIDFGTTNTSVSVAVGDRVLILPDQAGRRLHPSVVSYLDRGATLVGWDARERLATDPRRTVGSVKRLLGRSYNDDTVAGYLQGVAYRTSPGPRDSILIEIDGQQYAVPQVCSTILAHMLNLAERRGVTAKKAVVSVPVTSREPERAALRRAAQMAGLEIVDFIHEPLAGALAYGFGQDRNEVVAVYDFGGGTFDFTVIDVSRDNCRVLARAGDDWLGGDDFDLALAQHAASRFWKKTKVELQKRVVEWQRLLFACELAKRTLTSEPEAEIVVEHMIDQPRRIDLRQRIDRPELERLCKELVDRSLAVCEEGLARAGLEPSMCQQVIVTSGIGRIPFVRRELARFFDRELHTMVNPDEAICLGAGIYAARLAHHRVVGVHSPG
jgi:molecular chaperone DnaK